jgi:hypothetical protein
MEIQMKSLLQCQFCMNDRKIEVQPVSPLKIL